MKHLKNVILLGAFVGVAATGTGFAKFSGPEADASIQATDDAYIKADFTMVAPQISGVIGAVSIMDHQAVKAGDILFSLDDRAEKIAVEKSRADVEAAKAAVQTLKTQIGQHDLVVRQAESSVAMDKAALTLASSDVDRYQNLVKEGSGTAQTLQEAQTKMITLQATRDRDNAGLALARQSIDLLEADLAKADAGLKLAQANLDSAQLDLSYTIVRAPIDGIVTQNAVRPGAYADRGRALLAIVPLDALYIEANFRETQMSRIVPGQTVSFAVDAFPEKSFSGKVQSLGPASGASFSVIPPHNATGNFTKIVQRLPVRISIDPGQNGSDLLKVGMSVLPEIEIE